MELPVLYIWLTDPPSVPSDRGRAGDAELTEGGESHPEARAGRTVKPEASMAPVVAGPLGVLAAMVSTGSRFARRER